MRRFMFSVAAAAVILSSGACAGWPGASAPTPQAYAAVLADAARPEADRERDAARRTAETLAFARVRPGQSVADMIIGGGYFTRVLASAVGPEGHVTAWQPAEFIGFAANYAEAITAVDAIGNVSSIRSPIGAPEWPVGLDMIFTAQNYHDLHLTPFGEGTAAKVNAAAFAALNRGGYYVVVDHHAAAGSGLEAANTLHRIDIEAVKAEVTAAGFVLDGESQILASAGDPLTANVFDPSIRGQTSQFMLRFRKP